MQKCAFTGHRPQRFSFGFDEEAEECIQLKQRLIYVIEAMIKEGISVFFSGMALGVDQWAAQATLALKQQYPHVSLIAALPCETQANRWSPEQRYRYFDVLLPSCDDVITLQKVYTPDCMMNRNRWLVDHADCLFAVYDGEKKGGTNNTVQYARSKDVPIIAMHPETLEVTMPGFS